MAQIKILAFCGSLRTGSYNKKLVLQACEFLKEQGCTTQYLDLRELHLPLYDADAEDKGGMPEGAKKLVAAINESDALLIGNPEYNGGTTGVLKNTIDWASRAEVNPFMGKVVMLVGTSPGIYGASKSHLMTRQSLTQLKAIVTPSQVTFPNAESALDEKGVKDPKNVKFLQGACAEFVKFAGLFKKV